MYRRQFLQGALFAGFVSPQWAHAATDKTLVVIFQRGGCDGLNTVVPYGEDEYYRQRPSIAIPPPNPNQSRSAIRLTPFFGLHPSLAALNDIYRQGDLAIIPAVHFPEASRSHFVNQDMIESGATQRLNTGWLNRYLVTTQSFAGTIRGLSMGTGIAHALRGEAKVTAIDDLNQVGLDAPGDHELNLRARMNQVYRLIVSSNPNDINRLLVHQAGNILLDDLDLLNDIAVADPGATFNPMYLTAADYRPEYGALYPETRYGRQLRQTAQLIKANIGLEMVTVDMGGWDTHSQQGGAESSGWHAQRLQEFAEGIKALYTDLGYLRQQVIILTMTEFGRTVAENANQGTDHGKASAWFVIGAPIRAGIYGDWPGLLPEQLDSGRFLAYQVDYRDILAELLSHHFQYTQLATLLPQHTYHPVGFWH